VVVVVVAGMLYAASGWAGCGWKFMWTTGKHDELNRRFNVRSSLLTGASLPSYPPKISAACLNSSVYAATMSIDLRHLTLALNTPNLFPNIYRFRRNLKWRARKLPFAE
jgi:hypothetical protein